MKTVLITGATGLIGRELVKYFLKHSWSVVACSRELKKLNGFTDNFGNYNNLYKLQINLLNEKSIDTALNEIKSKGIKITHLVNGARSLETLIVDKDGNSSENALTQEMKLGVIAPYLLINKLVASSQNLRAIVNLSSQYGIVAPNPNLYEGEALMPSIGYGLSKAALNHLTKEMAVRLKDKKIRVNAIAFGGFHGRASEKFEEVYSKMLPIQRMLSIDEAGGPVEFLLDNRSSSINGHVLVADGGWTII